MVDWPSVIIGIVLGWPIGHYWHIIYPILVKLSYKIVPEKPKGETKNETKPEAKEDPMKALHDSIVKAQEVPDIREKKI